jgi:hypothetical protein
MIAFTGDVLSGSVAVCGVLNVKYKMYNVYFKAGLSYNNFQLQ